MFKDASIAEVGASSDAYHNQKAERGTATFAMSPSQLKEFSRCPQRWVNKYESPSSEAKEWGLLLDCLLLTPQHFETRYVVVPADAPKRPSKSQLRAKKPSKETVAAIEWWAEFNQSHPGCEIVDEALVSDCHAAIATLRRDEIAAAFVDSSDKQVLVKALWQDEATGLSVPARCLIDLAPKSETEFAKCLGDLKSGRSAALVPFQRQCFDLSWHVQAAFDLDLYVAATGEDRNTWCFIVQENFAPWQPGKRLLSQSFLELGRTTYQRQLANYCLCLKTGVWPGYDDTDEAIQGWSLIEPDPWMESKGLFDPRPTIAPDAEPVEEQPAEITP